MRDLKLFRYGPNGMIELQGQAAQIERSLQKLFESNLETLLGIRLLATEHSTGPVHGGRIDTLGLDEDGCPTIIEFKRSLNENVINQGLYYLDWLMDHKKEFQWLVMEKLGPDAARSVDWSAPRLVCIAEDFTRYDEHAVKQINRNIELLRYRLFNDNLLLIELVHAPKVPRKAGASAPNALPPASPIAGAVDPIIPVVIGDIDVVGAETISLSTPFATSVAKRVTNASPALLELYSSVVDHLAQMGDDVQVKELKYYVAFKRMKNFACVELYPQPKIVIVFLRVDPDKVTLEDGFARDVRNIGHHGTGSLEITIRSKEDLVKALPFYTIAYEAG